MNMIRGSCKIETCGYPPVCRLLKKPAGIDDETEEVVLWMQGVLLQHKLPPFTE